MSQKMMTPERISGWSRRTFLQVGAIAANWPFLNMRSGLASDRKIKLSDYPFKLGVASGDPSHDGVVLWTRLAPSPLDGGGMPPIDCEVSWTVAEDEAFLKVVQQGSSVAQADWAHSVHVEVQGLRPDRVYYYKFTAGGETSPVGRTRTSPAPGVQSEKFRFAFASCQNWEQGLFTAYEHMCQEDLHAVFHLGDYIYEGAATQGKVRQHNSQEIETLDEYRNRHALYKTDAFLQASHQAFPWIVTWDDHEFDNNCAGGVSEKLDVDPVDFLIRRGNAYKAYYEHMPLRRSALPVGPDMELYRTVSFGSLVQFNVLDTRQYRSDQQCGDKTKAPCEGVFDPNLTMLGSQQEKWLEAELTSSHARWNVLAQQVMMGRVDRNPKPDEVAWSMDQWAGYDVPRRRMLETLRAKQVSNPVVLTGDIHSNWVNDLQLDVDDSKSPVVATEFVGTSISSGGDGTQTNKDTAGILKDNSFVKFYNRERGYVSCEVTPDRWTSDYKVLEYVTRPGAPLITRASFEVESGRAGANRTT